MLLRPARRPSALALVLLAALVAPRNGRAGDYGTAGDLGDFLQAADEVYARRDQPGALEEVRSRLEAAERLAPDDYGVLWRQARLRFWMADDPALPARERSRLGKEAWAYGDRATQANPAGVEGWDYAAAGMGNYALGIGLFQALREGIEGKFKERLSRAERLDPDYEQGAIQTAWGRFWFELPWPKYDAGKAERALQAALRKNPDNVRAHVYLAQLLARERHGDRAHEELAHALAKPPGQYDAPEERRWQQVARTELEKKPAR